MSVTAETTALQLMNSMHLNYTAAKEARAALSEHFKLILEAQLPIGTVIDTALPGPGHRAHVRTGRGYGLKFRILSAINAECKIDGPKFSRWSAKAISVRDDGTTLGKELSLEGYVFDWDTRQLPTNSEIAAIIEASGGLKL
jgi:hypothetical protein